jgi:post-segregation antitoxin (ccd killing protein)
MRMGRINISIPDDLILDAKTEGMNISKFMAVSLAEELDRRRKIRALDDYLAELEAENGPVTPEAMAAAEAWADEAFAGTVYATPERATSNRKAA